MVTCAPAGTSATPPSQAAPSELVRGEEAINALALDACNTPCTDPKPEYVNTVRNVSGSTTFVELEPTRCQVPGFGLTPQECIGTCEADVGLVSIIADFGPIGPSTNLDLCHALEHDRGVAEQGSCDEVCRVEGRCSWPAAPDRSAVKLAGYVELTCSPAEPIATQPSAGEGLEPNQSLASNSISP